MILKFIAQNTNYYDCDLMLKFDTMNYVKVATLSSSQTKKVQYQTSKTSGEVSVYFHPLDNRYLDSEIIKFNTQQETFYLLDANNNIIETSDGNLFEIAH